MKPDIVKAVGVLAPLLAGTGCGGSSVYHDVNDQPSLPTTSVASTASPEDATPGLNERGYLVKSFGEPIGWGIASGSDDVVFTVDNVEVDPKCGASWAKPQDGRHTLTLQIRVTTGDDERAADLASGVINPWNLAEVGASGTFHPARAGRCFDNRLPTDFDANQKYRGVIEVEVPEASGIISMKNTGSTTDVRGWEWHYTRTAREGPDSAHYDGSD